MVIYMNNTLKTFVAIALFGSLVGVAQAADITTTSSTLAAVATTGVAGSAVLADAGAALFESANVASGFNSGAIAATGVFGEATDASLIDVGAAKTFVQSVSATGAASTQSQTQSVTTAGALFDGTAIAVQVTNNENQGGVTVSAVMETVTFTGAGLDAVTYASSATGTAATQVITPTIAR